MPDLFNTDSIDEMTLFFLESKGFSPTSDLAKALDWIPLPTPMI